MKPIFRTKRTPQNRETAWPGRFKGPIFEPHFPQPRGKTLPLNPLKNYTVLVRLARFPYNFPRKRARKHWLAASQSPIFPPKHTRNHGFGPLNALETMVLKRRRKIRAWPVHEAYFPYKTHPSKQGNSMAWPVQGTHFWTTFPPAPGAKRYLWIH